MNDFLFRASSIGKLMAEPKSIDESLITPEIRDIVKRTKRTDEEKAIIQTLKEKTLSEGAKTYIRELVWQEICGIDFELDLRILEKGIRVEQESIDLLNRVRGLNLTKNTERKNNGFITGECDLYDGIYNRGHDIKSAWSARTFHAFVEDCHNGIYEWQMRAYMMLWNADEWEVNYCLVNTPDDLIKYEPISEHIVDHIPEHMRLTTWNIKRDKSLEAKMMSKVVVARDFMIKCFDDFDRTHQPFLKEAA